jgi:hypothetical protein
MHLATSASIVESSCLRFVFAVTVEDQWKAI